MKRAICILFLAATSFVARSGDKCQIFIYGLDFTPSAEIHSAPITRYYADCADFQNSPFWNGREKFPLSLGAESRQAASFITKQKNLDSRLNLQWIRVQNCRLSENTSTNDNLAKTNASFAVFTFTTETIGQFVSAVELLNGAFAVERTSRTETAAGFVQPIGMEAKIHHFAGTNTSTPFLDALQSPNFQIPSTQWDPATAECPVDLENFVKLATSALTNGYSLSTDQLELVNFDFHHFIPEQAITAQHLNVMSNFHHWYCEITFVAEGEDRKYTAYLLLNGSVIQTWQD